MVEFMEYTMFVSFDITTIRRDQKQRSNSEPCRAAIENIIVESFDIKKQRSNGEAC